ncbi:MAG: hypothetical protein Q8L46_02440 [candidate division WWE3 bacterium]|nr:hypothetical protein [candidate division WWE3 bacterium]
MAPKKITLLIILLILLLAAGAAAAFYFFYYQPQQAALKEEGQTPPETAPAETLKDFTGQFVKGKVPEGWTVLEHQNGAGSSMLTSGVTYLGLTGLEVKNPGGTTVFKLEGVYGIGGLGSCLNYFQFSDDSAAYLSEIQGINAEVDTSAPAIVNLTSAAYKEYELFDVHVRRVEKKIYWDKTAGNAYFEAACGISEKIFNFTTPKFTGDSVSINSYRYTVNETSPETDLLELDKILDSLVTL